MPDPKRFKSQPAFMDECMHTMRKEEKRPQDQSVAICLSMWRRKDKKKGRKSKKCASEAIRCAAQALMGPQNPQDVKNEGPHRYIVNKKYEVVTEESAQQGDAADRGFEFEDETYDSLRDLIQANSNENWLEWSSSHVSGSPYEWLVSEAEQDPRTGEYKSYGLHIKRSDGKPLSRREMDAISQGLGVRKHPYIGTRKGE